MSAPDPRLDAIMDAAWARAEPVGRINDNLAAADQRALIHSLRIEAEAADASAHFHYRAAHAARDQLDRLSMVIGSLAKCADTPPELAAELCRLSDRVDDWLDLRVPAGYRIHPVSRLRPPDCQWPEGHVPPEWDEIADGVIEAAEEAIIRRAEDGDDEPGNDERRLPPPASGPFVDPGYIAECEYDAGGGL